MTTGSVDEKITSRFEELLKEFQAAYERAGGYDGVNGEFLSRHPSNADFFRLRAATENIIERVCGRNSAHARTLDQIRGEMNSYFLPQWEGVLRAARDDYQRGLLFDIRTLITAEVFTDFIEQADHLLSCDYHIAAASLLGAVLEDSLRKLCERHGIENKERTAIDALNADLARAEVYSKLVQKRITSFADIRNNAAHGHFERVPKQDVEDMLTWVRRFVADRLG
ncbi:MAG: hypothetical protein P4L90_06535 [Rhodopila sp.]|nr:hypothetical protein [Rhodopila sp.]